MGGAFAIRGAQYSNHQIWQDAPRASWYVNPVPATGEPPVPRTNRVRGLVLSILVGVSFFVVFEWGARAAGRAMGKPAATDSPWWRLLDFTRDPGERNDPYLGFAGTSNLYTPAVTDGREVLKTAPNKASTYRSVEFAALKEPGTLRIFCLGGSSVKSDGMHANGTFPTLLETGLRAALPGRKIEVINAGGGGTGSFQYREVAREVRHYGADLIVVYPEAGERRYLPPAAEGELATRDSDSPIRASARRFFVNSRLYIGIRDLIEMMRPSRAEAAANVTFSYTAIDAAIRPFSDETFTRVFDYKKDRVPAVMAPVLAYGEITKAHGRFVDNLSAIVDEARAVSVPVLLVDTVRNYTTEFYLRSYVEPRDVDPARAAEWRKHYETGIALKRQGRFEQAMTELLKVREFYKRDRDELLACYLGQCLENLQRYEKAREEYERSFLKHPLKLKLQQVARDTGAPLADPYPQLCKEAPNGIPDESMFMDAFHPMPSTNAVIANTILDEILVKNIIPKLAAPGAEIRAAARRAVREQASRIELFPERRIQTHIYRKQYAEALELAATLQPYQQNFLTLMYVGYAQAKVGDREGARNTWRKLKVAVLGPQGNATIPVPALKSDVDIVKYLFDGDLFSEF